MGEGKKKVQDWSILTDAKSKIQGITCRIQKNYISIINYWKIWNYNDIKHKSCLCSSRNWQAGLKNHTYMQLCRGPRASVRKSLKKSEIIWILKCLKKDVLFIALTVWKWRAYFQKGLDPLSWLRRKNVFLCGSLYMRLWKTQYWIYNIFFLLVTFGSEMRFKGKG